mgnify:FL=1
MVHEASVNHALDETIDYVPIQQLLGRSRCVVNELLFRCLRPKHPAMEAFLISTSVVALAEMGDKTQLLALVLAARFRKPWPIVLGIFVATIINHALAGAVGA